MIKKLRRKFIAVAMGSMAAVLILLIGGMNILNYRNMISDMELRLDILSENNGTFPVSPSSRGDESFHERMSEEPEKSHTPNYSSDDSGTSGLGGQDDMPLRDKPDLFHRAGTSLSAESAFDTRFFTVTLRQDGTIVTIDTGKIATVTTSEARDYAYTLFTQNKKSGFFNHYRYRVVECAGSAGTNTMYIFLYCGRELSSFQNSLFSSIAVSLLGLLLVYILVVFFSRRIVKPMAESYDKQKRFITDASHELKTPLAIIDANTEVLEMEAGENEWTKSIHNQVGRLNSLTQKLVFLSRMDEGNTSVFHMTEFSLSDAVEETASPFAAVATAGNKRLTLDITPGLTMDGDEANIRQLVSLLMDNAMKYSPENGEIRLTLSQSGKGRILTVWNTAESIAPGKHDIFFDRFYRADSSRNSKSGGFGIGLSVCQAIVLAHKGKISARSEDGKSLEIKVHLPV